MDTYRNFVQARIKWLPTHGENLHHASTGLLGECIELEFYTSPQNEWEELGDLCFYMEHFQIVFEKIWPRVDLPHCPRGEGSKHDCIVIMRQALGVLLDLTKKVWIYNKPLDPAMQRAFQLCIHDAASALWDYILCAGYTPEGVQAHNMMKLQKRFPTGYTDAAAQERADKK